MDSAPAIRALDFESRKVYHSAQTPGYTSWVSFFPGENGQWYLTCEEVTQPVPPLPQCTAQQWFEMGMPIGYDKSQYKMEMVILESRDEMQTWHVISREPCRFQHSAGQFGTIRTREGRFLRFVWSKYSLDPSMKPNEIFYSSSDNGKTWKKEPPFHDEHFVGHPHRLRMLRDGTLVLAVSLRLNYGEGTDSPLRRCRNLNLVNEWQMTLFFSYDQGHTWDGPLPIYGGQTITETDFVELPEGHLLCINNSNYVTPGRQFIYRKGRSWTPAPLERSLNAQSRANNSAIANVNPTELSWVPETVCLTEDGILVGCLRASIYQWSDDYGLTWWPLKGAPDLAPQMYQPWIQYLGNGQVVCAGHYGADDAIKSRDQYLVLHSFQVEVVRKKKTTHLALERHFIEDHASWPNAYTLKLTADGIPLPNKEIELWYVERYQSGYDAWNSIRLEERMKLGGKLLKLRTDSDGAAQVSFPEYDKIDDPHMAYQLVARFNADGSDPNYKPTQTPQFSQYCLCQQDPSL